MYANYLTIPAFNENRCVQLDHSQYRWVQLHPLAHPNDAPAYQYLFEEFCLDICVHMQYACISNFLFDSAGSNNVIKIYSSNFSQGVEINLSSSCL